jgi:hypothetical protein
MNGFRSLAVAVLAVPLGLAGAGTPRADTTLATSLVTARSLGWSTPVALSRSSLSLADTALAAEITGEMSVAWTVARGSGAGVWVRRQLADGSWAKAQLLDPGRDGDVGLLADPSGGVCALYSLVKDGSHLRVGCAGSDGVFQPPVELGTPGTQVGPYRRLVVDTDGNWTAGWIRRGDDGSRRVMVARRAEGQVWNTWSAVSPARTFVRSFDLDTSPEGVVTVAWAGRSTTDPASPNRIHARTLGGDEWSAAEIISGPGGRYPDVDSASGGRADVVWIRRADGFEEIQTRRRSSAGWEDIKTLSPRSPPGGWQYGYPPQVHQGGHGLTVFEWILYSPGDLDWDAQAFIVVRTKGRWGPTTLLGPSEGATERVRLVVDSAGTVVATWLHSKMPVFADAYTVRTRRKPLGKDWQEPRTLTGTVSADVSVGPTLVLDSHDRPALVWVGLKSHELSSYAPRVFFAAGT